MIRISTINQIALSPPLAETGGFFVLREKFRGFTIVAHTPLMNRILWVHIVGITATVSSVNANGLSPVT